MYLFLILYWVTPQRMRLQRRLYGIHTVCFLIFTILEFWVVFTASFKVIMQWKLIAVAYTLRTYWNQFSLGGICNKNRCISVLLVSEAVESIKFDNFDNTHNSFLRPEYFIDYLCERWIPCQASTYVYITAHVTVHCSTKDAYTSEITFLALNPWLNWSIVGDINIWQSVTFELININLFGLEQISYCNLQIRSSNSLNSALIVPLLDLQV